MYEYPARPVETIDGDTIDVVADLGFHIHRQIRLRLRRVDTHEIYGVYHDSGTYQRGKEEQAFVADWLDTASDGHDGQWPIVVETEKKGKYGRYLATVIRRSDDANLNDDLLAEFDGIKPE